MSTIEQKLLQAQQRRVVVTCDGHVTQGGNYEYASAEAIIKTARDVLADVGLTVLSAEKIPVSQTAEVIKDKLVRCVQIQARWRITDGQSSLMVESLGEATDYGDNATVKAQTDALKTMLRELLFIVVEPQQARSQQQPRPQPQRQPQQRSNLVPAQEVRALLDLAKKKVPGDELAQIVAGIAGRNCLVKDLTKPQADVLRKALENKSDKGG